MGVCAFGDPDGSGSLLHGLDYIEPALTRVGAPKHDSRMRTHIATRFVLPVLLLGALAGTAAAQNYPSRPVRLIVPYPPGGASDLHARHLTAKMTDLPQPVIIENRVGAGGNVAFDYVAKAAPDGYTLLWGAGSMTVAPA